MNERCVSMQMALLAFRIKEVVSTFYTHSGERLSVTPTLYRYIDT